MERISPLPLPVDELPENLRRFGDPGAPTPAKMMAAKGLVPIQGSGLVTLLCQLGADTDEKVKNAARATLEGLPDTVLLPACEAELHPAVLAELKKLFGKRDDVVERLVQNSQIADETLEQIARACSERISEIIAVNQKRLLNVPQIVEALYKNKNTRMSTADRLVELCARNDVELKGIPSFKAHVQAIQGQLIPEPTEEPLPTDVIFQELLDEDSDEQAIERDNADGTEELKERFKPLSFRIREMSLGEKIRLAIVGDAAARSILVRDPNTLVSHAAISSPAMNETEASAIAHSKEVSKDILRYIGNRKEWVRKHEVKRALVFNPKTPVGIALRFLDHMRTNDLKTLSRSRGIPNELKAAARQRLRKKGL